MNQVPISSTPFRRACVNCARAKAKCIVDLSGGPKCERCLRLKKDCQISLASRKRTTNKQSSSNKTARLEKKLDGLVSLLTNSAQSKAQAVNRFDSSAASAQLPSPDSPGSPGTTANSNTVHDRRAPAANDQNNGPTNGSYSSDGTSVHPHVPDQNAGVPRCQEAQLQTLSEANESLEIFRSQMIQYCPFVFVPPSATVEELRLQRPFMWLCVTAVTSKSSAQLVARGQQIRHVISQRMIVDGEANIDLLFGLLIYAAWSHYYIFSKPIVTSVIQLTHSLLFTLGLNKPPPKDAACLMLEYDARGCPRPFNPNLQRTRTMEDRRAAIGCWSISQMVSSYFQKSDTLKWTPYFDECLKLLAENGTESPADVLLVHIVRLQLVVEKIPQGSWHDGQVDIAGCFQAPVVFYVKALQTQISDVRRNIPAELQQNEMLLLHQYSAELTVHEIALSKAPIFSSGPDFQRFESLWACLQAAKNWFDLFLKFPPILYIGFSMLTYTELAHCFVAVCRISTFDHPEWDLKLVRDSIDLSAILHQVVTNFVAVKATARLDPDSREDNDVFSATSRRIKAIRDWWDAKITAESVDSGHLNLEETIGDMDLSDDIWLRDMLGLGDYQFDPYMQ